MPKMDNPRHEHFAQLLAEGHTAEQAYKEVGYKPNRHNAAALARKQHISTRVNELMERSAIRHDITKDRIQEMLEETYTLAATQERPADMRATAMDMAKLHGLVVEKRENTNTNYAISAEAMPKTPDEWLSKYSPLKDKSLN